MMAYNVIQDTDGSLRVVLSDPTGSTAEIRVRLNTSHPPHTLPKGGIYWVLLFGGQVVSWKNERRQEMLFMSNKGTSKQMKPKRGGIPICFPQLSNYGTLEQHGFARNRFWSLDSSPSPLPVVNNQMTVDIILKSTDEDLKTWAHRFELRLRVSLSAGKLTLTPRVRNIDSKPFSFTFALCNYLSVSDISEVRVEGLETLDYFDNMLQKERFTEQADAITFDGEIDRVYLSTPTKIAIIDHEKKRTFVVRKEGMPDAVVWNPWANKAKSLPDLGDGEYKIMLRVDPAAVETPITLKPSEEWKGRQELSTVSSSYCSGQLDPRRVIHGSVASKFCYLIAFPIPMIWYHRGG